MLALRLGILPLHRDVVESVTIPVYRKPVVDTNFRFVKGRSQSMP